MESGRRTWPGRLVIIAIALFALYFSWFSLRKAEVFDSYSSDLGNMWQTVWNVAHGNGFQFTHTGLGQNVPRLSVHSDYILILLAPLSWLPFGVGSLLVLQALIVGLGGWFVYRLGCLWLKDDRLAALVALQYLCFGPLQFSVVWQFHAITLVPTFLLAMTEAIVARRRVGFVWLWFGLALITKEQVGLIAGLMAAILWWWQGQKRRAIYFFSAGWIFSWVHLAFVIPAFRRGLSPNVFWNFYFGDLGSTPSSQLGQLLQPVVFVHHLFTTINFQNILFLLLPLALLPIFSGWILLAGLAIVPHWLSINTSVNNLYFQNHDLALAPLFLASLMGLRRVRDWFGRHGLARPKPLAIIIIFWFAVGSFIFSPNPWSFKFNPDFFRTDPELHTFVRLINSVVPENTRVAFSGGIGNYVRNHREAYQFPYGLDRADVIVVYSLPAYPSELATTIVRRQLIVGYQAYFAQSAAYRLIGRTTRGAIYRRRWDHQPEPLPADLRVPPTQ